MKTANFANLWDDLLAEGHSTFTTTDLQERTGASLASVYSAVKYAMDRHRLFSPARGLYVVVPPEHRAAGVVPAVHFIDPMMRHLGVDYYVAYASAAQWWGAAHQAAQAFDVVASRNVLDRDLGPVRMRFHTSSRIDTDAVRRVVGPRTMLSVASPSLTAVDLASRPRIGGGLSAVATILSELPDLDGNQLADLAGRRTMADARRLGWLLELIRSDVDLAALRQVAQPDDGRPTLLAPRGTRQGHIDDRWGVLVNATVEPDET
ncbi:MAG: type IV toxin-antitoxin system AbiEi family antitoxin [Microthrixaceae bacterium]